MHALICFFTLPLILVDFLRVYIFFHVFQIIDRFPSFTDGFDHPKTVLFSWQLDEMILLFGHFLNFLLLALIFTLLYALKDELRTKWYFIFMLLLLLFEILVRNSIAYEYIMYD